MVTKCPSPLVTTAWTGSALVTLLALACSASSEEPSEIDRGTDGGSGQPTAIAATNTGSTSGTTTGGIDLESSSTGSGTTTGNTCATASTDATLTKEPVDIILVVDNSGSMQDELLSVEANINDSFGNILLNSDIDYRLIALSRHRNDDNTSLCITQPLSTLTACPAEAPGLSDRFFHYSTKVESNDSFDLLLDTYAAPFQQVCLSACDNADTVGGSDDDNEDNYENAPLGWSQWLRAGAKKVFLEITDDNEDMLAQTFIEQLTQMAPEHFGTASAPTFVFHSITGVAEKTVATDPYLPTEPIVDMECTGNGGDVSSPGVNYQELSILTGGLRLPVCQFTAYSAVFQAIAEDVIVKTDVACEFPIPEAPAGSGEINLDNVAVNYVKGDGSGTEKFGQAAVPAECGPGAFYIQDNTIVLCAEACETIRADPFSSVDVLFTCESQIIIK